MMKKLLGVFTSIVAALAVVGVAWAGADDATPASVTSAEASAGSSAVTDTSVDDSTPTTGATSTSASTPTTVETTTSGSEDDGGASSSTSTSTSLAATTSTSEDRSSTTSTTVGSSTSTSFDDSDGSNVPDQVKSHTIPGVGSVTIEVADGKLRLSGVSAPGWEIERRRVEADRIELELRSGEAEAKFEARLRANGVEVKAEVDFD